jgi:hypothetical protein
MIDDTEIITTDEAILDSIGEGDESTSSTEESTTDSPTAADSTGTSDGASGEQGATDGTEDYQRTKTAAGPQDLVDRSGNVIATGGKERRFYETAQKEKTRADTATREVENLRGQLQAINDAGNIGTQYNLSPEEVTTGAQIIAAYKTDPVNTLKYMLTQAQASGHNIEELGNAGLDAGAVKQMLESALAPLLSEHQERIDTQDVNDRALEIYNEFSSNHPDAAVHENSLARLLTQEPSLSPEAAYYKLQNYYLSRGLDWTKSLEQLQSEVSNNPVPGDNTPQPPDGGVNVNNVTNTPQVADVNTSFDDIIRESMNAAGIT